MCRHQFSWPLKSWPFSSGWLHLIVRLRPSHYSLFSVCTQSAHLSLPTSQETAEPSIYLSSGFLGLNTVDILGQIIPRCGGEEAVLGAVGCLTESMASSKNCFPRSMTVPGRDNWTCLRTAVGQNHPQLETTGVVYFEHSLSKALSCFPSHIFCCCCCC